MVRTLLEKNETNIQLQYKNIKIDCQRGYRKGSILQLLMKKYDQELVRCLIKALILGRTTHLTNVLKESWRKLYECPKMLETKPRTYFNYQNKT